MAVNPSGSMIQANWPPVLYEPREDQVRIGNNLPAIHPVEIVHRILGAPNRFRVLVTKETWGDAHPDIMHVALLDTGTKQIVRFEEVPERFPSDALIDKLRLLR